MSTTGAAERGRVPAFDALRIVAIALVVAAHLFQRYQHPFGLAFGVSWLYWSTIGGVGVTLLIVISGALIERRYGGTGIGWAPFMWRRVTHLYPAYFLALALTLTVFGRALPAATPLVRVLDLLGAASLVGVRWKALMLPMSWFLGVIMGLYALWPLLTRAMAKWPRLTLLAAFVLSVVARVLSARYLPMERVLDWFLPNRVFEFVLGMWLVRSPRVSGLFEASAMPGRIAAVLAHVAALTFPIYLIHGSVRDWSLIDPLSPGAFVVVFLAILFGVSEAMLAVVRPIERLLRRAGRDEAKELYATP